MNDDPAMSNFYMCWEHDGQRWCYGCWCLPCLLGANAKNIPGRRKLNDCLLSCFCAPDGCVNLGAGYINIKQREALDMPGDECGALLCAQCVACDTARIVNPKVVVDTTLSADGLTEKQLLAPIRLQPTSHT